MQTTITGRAYVLGDNVDTDQIIPAQYLTFNPSVPEEYKMFGKYALSSVPPSQAGLPKGHVPFHTKDEFVSDYKIIVAGKNFGCRLVSANTRPIAAPRRRRHPVRGRRILRPHLLPQLGQRRLHHPVRDRGQRLCDQICTGDELHIDVAAGVLSNVTTKEKWQLKPLGEVAPIIDAGGIFAYAKKVGMLRG